MRNFNKYHGTDTEKVTQAIVDCKKQIGVSAYQYCIATIRRESNRGTTDRSRHALINNAAKSISNATKITGFRLYAMIIDATTNQESL
jgi:hypothetical protein